MLINRHSVARAPAADTFDMSGTQPGSGTGRPCVASLYEMASGLWVGTWTGATRTGLWRWTVGAPAGYLATPIQTHQSLTQGDRGRDVPALVDNGVREFWFWCSRCVVLAWLCAAVWALSSGRSLTQRALLLSAVTVTVTNTDTQVSQTVATSATGDYSVPSS